MSDASPSPIPGTLTFVSSSSTSSSSILADKAIPAHLARSTTRLQLPPSYVIVGAHRLCTDEQLYKPVWDKCRHGVRRGLVVGVAWVGLTFHIQRKFVKLFMLKSPGISPDAIFGIPLPFDLPTYTTLLLLSSQLTLILSFFLSRNIRIARDRAWDQTLHSRGKGPDFWKPYAEEWVHPPVVKRSSGVVEWLVSSFVGKWALKLLLGPLYLVPIVGMVASAGLKALGKARYHHQPYYKAKGMSKDQIAVFIEERKWDYRVFGFTASLLEGLPFIGIFFSVSNRIGAAMWAHDLEKRQHYVAEIRAGGGALVEGKKEK